MGRFSATVAVVTGAANGIGATTAALLARQGAAVALLDIDAEETAAVVKAIEAEGGQAIGVDPRCVDPEPCREHSQDAVIVAAHRLGRGEQQRVLDVGIEDRGSGEAHADADHGARERIRVRERDGCEGSLKRHDRASRRR